MRMNLDSDPLGQRTVAPDQARGGVIEDNADNLYLAITLLREDLAVRECTAHRSDADFFQWALAASPGAPGEPLLDLLLLDLHMPRESGYDILARLRAIPGLE